MTALVKEDPLHFHENLSNLREAMGIMQHHDAVTGTEKQHVAEDYARILQIGIEKCSENVKTALNQLTVDADFSDVSRNHRKDPNFRFDFATCDNLNISACEISEKNAKFMVTLYNPLAHSVSQNIRVPIIYGDYEIFDYRNAWLTTQTVAIPAEILALSYRRSSAESELVFRAEDVPPLGYQSYFVQRKRPHSSADNNEIHFQSQPFSIGNKFLNLSFDQNGMLESASIDGISVQVSQNFYVYEGAVGDNKEFKNRSSGAYIFRPKTTEAQAFQTPANIRIVRGELVDEVHQVNLAT